MSSAEHKAGAPRGLSREDALSRRAHEMRTDLAVITGFALTLRDRGERMRPEQWREALEAIIRRSQSLAPLLEEILLDAQDRGQPPRRRGDPPA